MSLQRCMEDSSAGGGLGPFWQSTHSGAAFEGMDEAVNFRVGFRVNPSTGYGMADDAQYWAMRSEAQEVRPNLLLSNVFFARKRAKLKEAGVTHVLVCGGELEMTFEGELVYVLRYVLGARCIV